MAPDTNQAAAAVDTYGRVVRAEVATELVNRARALVLARLYEIEEDPAGAKPDETEKLEARERELFAVLRSLDYRDDSHVEAVIARFGPLLRDEARFWAEMTSAA